jgi:AcrR family transcriptional regulator
MADTERSKVDLRRDDLRERLILLAEGRIAADGAASLKARMLAAQAGCAVGAIYNVFDDMTALVMQVNVRTFAKLGASASAAMTGAGDARPQDQLIRLSQAYLHFAAEHFHLWRALFEVDTQVSELPDWYRNALDDLFAMIAPPVRMLFPALPAAELDLFVRALFSAVHGIVLLGLQNNAPGASVAKIEQMIAMLMTQIGH